MRQLRSLYIEARFDEILIKRVLFDNGATTNVLTLSVFKVSEKNPDDLVGTGVIVSGFNRRASAYLRVVPILLRVRNREGVTTFFVNYIDITGLATMR